MKRTNVMKLLAVCLAGALVTGSVSTPASAAKKVTIKGKKKLTMTVGAKKTIKANQKVKWTVKGKSIKIVKGKNAKAVTVQAKKKGSATLTAKKGKKKASVKIQVTKKTTTQTSTPQKNPAQVNTTDVTKMTDPSFYKVTKVNGNLLTLLSKDNKEYTTTLKSDIPIFREDAVATAASIQVGEYFRCCPYSFQQNNQTVTNYAILIISESDYNSLLEYQKKDPNGTYCATSFYVTKKDGDNFFDIAASPNGTKITTIYADEDTRVVVNGTKQYNGSMLTNGMRVLIKYRPDALKQDLAWVYSIVAY
ncbi:MAG: hypothetical protein K2K70_09780 [Lachnospiraceae bacterium]|nr:hypothetical protein [Lachnospiraceae bacterium]